MIFAVELNLKLTKLICIYGCCKIADGFQDTFVSMPNTYMVTVYIIILHQPEFSTLC